MKEMNATTVTIVVTTTLLLGALAIILTVYLVPPGTAKTSDRSVTVATSSATRLPGTDRTATATPPCNSTVTLPDTKPAHENGSVGTTPSTPVPGPEAIPKSWQERCQFLELPLKGDEGERKGLKLRGLAFLFRHGERAPIGYGGDAFAPYRPEDRKRFDDYVETFNSADFQDFMKFGGSIKDKVNGRDKERLVPLPHRSHCEPGDLTAEGALQHLDLGGFMNGRYAESSLFKDASKLDVYIDTTDVNRTLQSAIAFTTGFLYPLKDKIPGFVIDEVPSKFCYDDDPTCYCRSKDVSATVKEERNAYALQYVAKETLREINEVRKFDKIYGNSLYQTIDVALGLYVCRRRPLPRFNATFGLTYDLLERAATANSDRARAMFDAGDKYALQRLHLVKAQPQLVEFSLRLQDLQKPDRTLVQIFSAHDTTLSPHLAALGIPFDEPPHYRSRVVYEVYEKGSPNELLLRILYNGKDYTDQLYFCKGLLVNGLCPLKEYVNYATRGIFDRLNFSGNKLAKYCESEEWQQLGQPKAPVNTRKYAPDSEESDDEE